MPKYTHSYSLFDVDYDWVAAWLAEPLTLGVPKYALLADVSRV